MLEDIAVCKAIGVNVGTCMIKVDSLTLHAIISLLYRRGSWSEHFVLVEMSTWR